MIFLNNQHDTHDAEQNQHVHVLNRYLRLLSSYFEFSFQRRHLQTR